MARERRERPASVLNCILTVLLGWSGLQRTVVMAATVVIKRIKLENRKSLIASLQRMY